MCLVKGRTGARTTLYFPTLSLVRSLGSKPKHLAGGFHIPLIAIPCLFITFALARPCTTKEHKEYQASGVDIVLAIDVSLSMEINDFYLDGSSTNRLHAAQVTAKNFIDKRPNDRIGIVAFAGRPYLVSPLTMSHDWLPTLIDEEVVTSHEVAQGTAIGSAVGFSSLRLDSNAKNSKTKIVILITDGSSNSGKLHPEQAAQFAKTLGVKVYTLAIGTKEGRLPGNRFNAPVQFDTKTLENIASITDGKYYRATSIETLEESFNAIDQLEKVETTIDRFLETKEYHFYFTSFAVVSLSLILLFSSLHPRNTP